MAPEMAALAGRTKAAVRQGRFGQGETCNPECRGGHLERSPRTVHEKQDSFN